MLANLIFLIRDPQYTNLWNDILEPDDGPNRGPWVRYIPIPSLCLRLECRETGSRNTMLHFYKFLLKLHSELLSGCHLSPCNTFSRRILIVSEALKARKRG